ncbi:hypothetical protein ACPW96_23020 [Micromonospora sp. DT81.3]|uniref:hypothetical protein n=1 Tax=Micromonospora sp. DT81.3 TaxID=3416523 RepID=UPI003CF35863
MRSFLELLRRLDTDGPPFSNHIYRLTAPSSLHFDDTILRIDAVPAAAAQALGTYPTPISVLHWMDAGDSTGPIEAQALASELGALLTFVSNRRVQVAADEVTLGMAGSDIVTFMPASINDTEVIGPIEVDVKSELERVSGLLRGLPGESAVAVGAAIELHYAATLLHASDVNTAYTLVVAGIETLAAHFNSQVPIWADFSARERFDSVFDALGLDDAQAGRLRDEILEGQHLRLQHRFISFVVDGLPASFWDTEVHHYTPQLERRPDGEELFNGYGLASSTPMANWVPKDIQILKKRLAATYAARSQFVHAGVKSHDMGTALAAAAGTSSGQDRKLALPFAGLRRVLRELIFAELGKAEEMPLPDIRLIRFG